jgi:hypothetical protein
MERIFWLLSGSDSQTTRALMEQFERTQSLQLPKDLHNKVGNQSHPKGLVVGVSAISTVGVTSEKSKKQVLFNRTQ